MTSGHVVGEEGSHEGKMQVPPPQLAVAENALHVLPQVGPNPDDYPEVVHPVPSSITKNHHPTICGLRKRYFWIVAAILLIVIGAAVGGGVGGPLSSKKSSPGDQLSPPGNSSVGSGKSLLPNTSLAAVNYTKDNVEWHRVFFQTAGDGLYQSAWNSSAKTWTVSPIAIKDGDTPRSELFKTPTPIAASFYACSSNTPNLTLYFLDSSSRLRQLQTSNPSDGAWSLGPADSDYNVLSASSLAAYSCGHAAYPDYSSAWFQDSDSYYNMIDASSGTKQRVDNTLAAPDVDLVKPPQNSSLALIPHYISAANTTAKGPPYLSFFYVNSDKLYEYHYNASKYDFKRIFNDQTLAPAATIAGFSWGYNHTLGSINGMQLLYTMPDDSSGGVSVLRLNKYNGGEWASTGAADAANPFQKVARYSGIAATQAGRVYAVVEEGGAVEMREWAYEEVADTYEVLGRVETEVR